MSEIQDSEKLRYGRNVTNKWFYREKTCCMPRMRNLPPYDANEIVRWFAELYQCDLPAGRKHFAKAASLSAAAAKANPTKWPPFLLFDKNTREWHGFDVP